MSPRAKPTSSDGCKPDVALCRLSYRPAGRTGLEPVTSHSTGDNRFTSARQRTTVKHYRPLAKPIISPGTGSVKILLPHLCVYSYHGSMTFWAAAKRYGCSNPLSQ